MTMETLVDTKVKSPYIAPGIRSIDDIVADVFGVSVENMKKPGRKRIFAEPRMFAMWFRTEYINESCIIIGSIYGRDHSTVLYAKRTVPNWIETNKPYRDVAIMALRELQKAGYFKSK